jgi:hypothetical protein
MQGVCKHKYMRNIQMNRTLTLRYTAWMLSVETSAIIRNPTAKKKRRVTNKKHTARGRKESHQGRDEK